MGALEDEATSALTSAFESEKDASVVVAVDGSTGLEEEEALVVVSTGLLVPSLLLLLLMLPALGRVMGRPRGRCVMSLAIASPMRVVSSKSIK